MSKDLLDCPFCGKPAEIVEFKDYGCTSTYVYYDVGCDTDDCFAVRREENYYKTAAEAKEEWNKRPTHTV